MAHSFLDRNTSHASGSDSPRTNDAMAAPEAPVSALPRFMSVRQVAEYLHLNEKKVYALASEGKIPATKVTGKWLFPRHLIDEWMLASSHGGVLTDRIALVGSDDPLIWRAVMNMANEIQGQALLSYSCTGTQLGLNLLARQRADVCAMHWGPAAESIHRHPALIRQYPQHHNWVVVRVFYREQGLICAPGLATETGGGVERVFQPGVRWAMRQEGAGSQRFFKEIVAKQNVDPAGLRVTARAFSEREAASLIAMDHAEVAPGVLGAAAEFGLDFVPIGWEAYDFALNRGIYFRNLFQKLMDHLKGPECQRFAQLLGGYDFKDSGRLIWSE